MQQWSRATGLMLLQSGVHTVAPWARDQTNPLRPHLHTDTDALSLTIRCAVSQLRYFDISAASSQTPRKLNIRRHCSTAAAAPLRSFCKNIQMWTTHQRSLQNLSTLMHQLAWPAQQTLPDARQRRKVTVSDEQRREMKHGLRGRGATSDWSQVQWIAPARAATMPSSPSPQPTVATRLPWTSLGFSRIISETATAEAHSTCTHECETTINAALRNVFLPCNDSNQVQML